MTLYQKKHFDLMLWVQKWSHYTLNRRGDEVLYFKNSLHGNNTLQLNYSFLHYCLMATTLPFVRVLDPTLQLFSHIKLISIERQKLQKKKVINNFEIVFFSSKEKLKKQMETG